MQKKWFFFGGAAVCLAISVTAAIQLINSSAAPGSSSVPEFVMPARVESSEAPAQTTATVPAPGETTGSAPASSPQEKSGTESAPAEITSAVPAESSAGSDASTNSTAQSRTEPPDTTTTAVESTAAHTASNSPQSDEPPEPEPVPVNIMLTSNDPLHQLRFEFSGGSISFTGNYNDTEVSEIAVLRSKVESNDLSLSGSSLSGTLDVSMLKPGYYIISVKLKNGERMNYVFEMTETGAQPVPVNDIPAESNLHAAANPIELPQEGVLAHIAPGGDAETARQLIAQVRELADDVCAGLDDDYAKARALAQWVSENMYYDRDASENGVSEASISLEAVLETHRSVCFGWSNLYAALCESQGIECYVASGSVVTGSRCFPQTVTADERSHSWNLVRLPDRDIWVDTVWDSSNSYERRSYTKGGTDMQYFDISNDVLAHDHRVTRFEHRDYFALR